MTHTLADHMRGGISGLALLRGIALLLATVGSILVARNIGVDAYGQLSLVLAIAAVLAIPSSNTIIPFLVRFTATNDHSRQYPRLVAAWRWAVRRTWFWAAVGFSVALLIAAAVAWQNSPEAAIPYAIAALLPLLWAQAAQISGILQGLHRVVLAQMFDWLVQPVLYIVFVVALLLFGELTLNNVLLSVVAATLVSIVVGTLLKRREQKSRSSATHDMHELPTWQKAWRHYLVIQTVGVASAKFPLLIVGILTVSQEAGQYRAAESIATLLALLLAIANAFLGPLVTRMYNENRLEELQKTMQLISRAALLVAIPLFTLLVVGGEQLISFIYGDEFGAAYFVMIVLLVGQLVNIACGSVALLLNMTGHEDMVSKSLGWAFLASIILCFILVPSYGALGAAIAASSSMMLWHIVQLVRSIRTVRVNPSIF
ncbi:MAG: O-antigen/teichoic acid export membrane protein [Candidatus Azotimanducaceae bacterium]